MRGSVHIKRFKFFYYSMNIKIRITITSRKIKTLGNNLNLKPKDLKLYSIYSCIIQTNKHKHIS